MLVFGGVSQFYLSVVGEKLFSLFHSPVSPCNSQFFITLGANLLSLERIEILFRVFVGPSEVDTNVEKGRLKKLHPPKQK